VPSSCQGAQILCTSRGRPECQQASSNIAKASRYLCLASAMECSSWFSSLEALCTKQQMVGSMVIRASGGSQLYAYDSSQHGVHKESVWMSHGDSIDKLPEGFQPVATSEQVTLQLPQHARASFKQAIMNCCWQSATKDLKRCKTVLLVVRYACSTRC